MNAQSISPSVKTRGDSTLYIFTGFSIINHGAEWLDNVNARKGVKSYAIHAGVRWFKPHRYFNWSIQCAMGQYQDLGDWGGTWNEKGNFVKWEGLARLNLLRFYTPNPHPKHIPEAFFGYAFDAVPMNKTLGYNTLGSAIAMGFSYQWKVFPQAGIWVSSGLNQQIGANYRTYLKYDLSAIFHF